MTGAAGRDARVVWRGLLAGGAVAAVVATGFGLALSGAGAAATAVGVWLGLAAGGFVASGWLLLALALDLAARQRPSRARLLWTFGVTALALVLPFLALAAGSN